MSAPQGDPTPDSGTRPELIAKVKVLLSDATVRELMHISGLALGLANRAQGYVFSRAPSPIAHLAVGESTIIDRRLWSDDKVKARQLLGDPKAQWKANALAAPEGKYRTRVTRVR